MNVGHIVHVHGGGIRLFLLIFWPQGNKVLCVTNSRINAEPGSLITSIHQDLAPAARRICSYESQNVRDQGAILSQQGRKPL